MAVQHGKEKFYGLSGKSQTAFQKRNQQLQVWERSETNKEPEYIRDSRRTPRVKFDESVIFLAAVQSSDMDEVERLIQEEGADVNCLNKDGLTALHQCCIDDDFDMVQVLVRHKANINAQDNEGWTPLHAAASCGHDHIVRYLLEKGAFPAPVNNEGDTPADLSEEESIVDMLREQIEIQGIDVEEVRLVEEQLMLQDANRLKNDPSLDPVISPGGATPLHVAAAKSYLEVMKVLLSIKGIKVDLRDKDGWTPLHAAVYWGNMVAAELLVAYGSDLTATTNNNDTVQDLCDPDLTDELEGLKRVKEEQNNRQRRNAMITSRDRRESRPSLSHTNSREDMKEKPSPGVVRRRSSKERSLFPKQDMLKEREERENWATDSTETNSLGLNGGKATDDGTVVRRPSKERSERTVVSRRDMRGDGVIENDRPEEARDVPLNATESEATNNNAKEAINILHEEISNHSTKPHASSMNDSPILNVGQTSPPKDDSPKESPNGSPKISKKRPNMSTQMLKRVGLWETQKNNAPPLTSTPISSPQTEGGEGKRFSMPQTETPVVGGDVKRYSFQPKTVPLGEMRHDRTMSETTKPSRTLGVLLRNTSYEDAMHKRGSYDETRLQAALLPLPETPYKSSSLPRSSKIGTQGTDTPSRSNTGSDTRSSKIGTEGTDTPSRSNTDIGPGIVIEESVVSSEGTPTPNAVTVESYVRDITRGNSVDRGTSVESNISTGSNRSATFSEESETNRRRRAKRTRETRKSTQPVPADILKQISIRDAEELAKMDAKEKEESPTEEDVPPVQSAFKPRSRPASKLVSGEGGGGVAPQHLEPALSLWFKRDVDTAETAKEKETASKEPAPSKDNVIDNDTCLLPDQTKRKPDELRLPTAADDELDSSEVVYKKPDDFESFEGASKGEDSSLNSPGMHPRTKSTARRRPRRERRSTGLVCEAEADEDIPESLEGIVKRKLADPGASELCSLTSEDYPESLESSLAADRQLEEAARLKQLIQEERGKNQRLQEDYSRVMTEMERYKTRVSELNRRCEDVSRAYEQEKREKEQREARITELEESSKNIQYFKNENQRLKDENSALIRVIGKLSRGPVVHA